MELAERTDPPQKWKSSLFLLKLTCMIIVIVIIKLNYVIIFIIIKLTCMISIVLFISIIVFLIIIIFFVFIIFFVIIVPHLPGDTVRNCLLAAYNCIPWPGKYGNMSMMLNSMMIMITKMDDEDGDR